MNSNLSSLAPSELFARARFNLRGLTLGDESGLIAEAEATWNAAVEALVNAALLPPRMVRDFVFESGVKLQQFAIEAFQAGATAAGEAFEEAAKRLARALATMGASLGQILAELMGAQPWDFALLGASLLVLLGAGLFLTPGGQALAPNLIKALVRP